MLKTKRIYDPSAKKDGFRVLVDRLWPRGVSKDRAHLGVWMKEIAPSDVLRKSFAHNPAHWKEFVTKYRGELKHKKELLQQSKLLEAEHGTVTLLYAARDEEHNQAAVLCKFIESDFR